MGRTCRGDASGGWADYLRSRLAIRLAEASLEPNFESRLSDWVSERLEKLVVPAAPVLLHHDLKPANLIVTEEKFVLIDFEQAKGGDPLSDLAKLRWRAFGQREDLWSEFCTAYMGSDRTMEMDQRVLFYQALHCLGSIAYRTVFANRAYAFHVDSARAWLRNLLFEMP